MRVSPSRGVSGRVCGLWPNIWSVCGEAHVAYCLRWGNLSYTIWRVEGRSGSSLFDVLCTVGGVLCPPCGVQYPLEKPPSGWLVERCGCSSLCTILSVVPSG